MGIPLIKKGTGLLTNIHISSLVSNVVFSISTFVSFIILSRNIPPTILGSWVLFLTVASFIDMAISGLTRNAVIYFGSGDDDYARHLYNAASLAAMIGIFSIISIAFIITAIGFGSVLTQTWRTILFWYPVYGLSGLWRMSSLSYLQARGEYHRTINIRLINTLLFLLFCVILLVTEQVTLINLIIFFTLASTASSLYGYFKKWDSSSYLKKVSKKQIVTILHYGKYTLFTNLGTSLLKSADLFIIGLSPIMGTLGVAIYTIPFKIVEILEIPLRSLAMSSFNEISILSKKNDMQQISRLFIRYNIIMFLVFLPILGFFILFPRFQLVMMGGGQYSAYMPVMISIVYTIVIYGFLMIPDRMTGVVLEGIGKPKGNTVKTGIMAILNIIGNLIAVFYFKSIVGVAYATLAFTLAGIIIGYFFLRKTALVFNKEMIKEEFLFIIKTVISFFHKVRKRC